MYSLAYAFFIYIMLFLRLHRHFWIFTPAAKNKKLIAVFGYKPYIISCVEIGINKLIFIFAACLAPFKFIYRVY
jgi:hypothetical protein